MATVKEFKKKHKKFFSGRHRSEVEGYAAHEKNGQEYLIVLQENWYDAEQNCDNSLVVKRVMIWSVKPGHDYLSIDLDFEATGLGQEWADWDYMRWDKLEVVNKVKQWIDDNA